MEKINKKIIEILEEQRIPINTGILCLLGIYYGIDYEKLYDTSSLIQTTVSQLNVSGIYTYDLGTNEVIWYLPLLEGENVVTEWDWLHEYRDMFRAIRKDAGGTYDGVRKKMQKFFADHPSVRKEDILLAAEMYLRTLSDPKYIQRADYFIKKNGPDPQSRLEEYLEIVKTNAPKKYEMMI